MTTEGTTTRPERIAPDADALARQLEDLRGQRVVVAMSGGVDSAVAALMLCEAGAEVVGLALRLHDAEPHNPLAPRACCAPDDLQDARRIAEALGIPFYVLDAREPFDKSVVQPFVNAYLGGRTPNPCVRCNGTVKLGLLHRRARALGAARFATGHYARRIDGKGGPELHKAVDAAKDQSYFLHAISPQQLDAALFPLGEIDKSEVRRRARAAGLPVHDKKDSTGICFIGERPFREFLAQHLPDTPGPIESADDPARNALIVVQEHDHPLLMSRRLRTLGAHWLMATPDADFTAAAKIRYRQTDQPCAVSRQPEGRLAIDFAEPQRAATPGQSVVLYAGERCLGGAVIEAI